MINDFKAKGQDAVLNPRPIANIHVGGKPLGLLY